MPAATRAAPKAPARPRATANEPAKPVSKAKAAEVEANIHPDGKVWIDLLNPDEADNKQAHLDCGKRIPTKEQLSEVESSSRHFIEDGAIYLSLPMIYRDKQDHPHLTPVGFIVTPDRLVTIRFVDLRAFETAREAAKVRHPGTGYEAFTEVIEAIVDTEADILEHLGDELEKLNQEVFIDTDERRPTSVMRNILRRLGRCGEKLGKLRHSLATLARISAFVVDHGSKLDQGLVDRLNATRDDVDSLAHFQEALTNKSQFLLDAALGFINIDQNDVIKVLTVVSVVGVPPTLVASIYGMNFKNMPELDWHYGYPYALGLIVLTTALPLLWFKWKKWF